MLNNKTSFRLVVFLIFILSIIVRIIGISKKESWSYDESNSFRYVCINELKYKDAVENKRYPFDTIVPVKEWYSFLYHIDCPFCFKKLNENYSDNIGILFYALLHTFLVIFGVNLYSGLYLNLLLWGIFYFLLIKLFKKALANYNDTLFALFYISFSWVCLQINFEARPHLLFATISLFTFYYIMFLLNENKHIKWHNLLIIYSISLLGFSTLVTYIFVAFIMGLIILLHHRKISKFLGLYILTVFMAILTSEIVKPFYLNLYIHNASSHYYDKELANHGNDLLRMLFVKFKVTIYYSFQFFSYYNKIVYLSIVGFLILISAYIVRIFRSKRINWSGYAPASLIFFALSYSIMVVLYVLARIPATAVGEQYYMFIWPFFVIFFIILINQLLKNEKLKYAIKFSILMVILISGITSYDKSVYLRLPIYEKEVFYNKVRESDLIIIPLTNNEIGDIGRFFYNILPHDKKVLVTSSVSIPQIHRFITMYPRIMIFGDLDLPIYNYYQVSKIKLNSEYLSKYDTRTFTIIHNKRSQ